jgi:hypothetical protein
VTTRRCNDLDDINYQISEPSHHDDAITKLVMADILKKRVLNLAGVTNQELPIASTCSWSSRHHNTIYLKPCWGRPHEKLKHLEEQKSVWFQQGKSSQSLRYLI